MLFTKKATLRKVIIPASGDPSNSSMRSAAILSLLLL
jgi:hypothetical protein